MSKLCSECINVSRLLLKGYNFEVKRLKFSGVVLLSRLMHGALG